MGAAKIVPMFESVLLFRLRGPKTIPRWAKNRSRGAKIAQRPPQETLKRPSRCPMRCQDAPKRQPRASKESPERFRQALRDTQGDQILTKLSDQFAD